MSNKHRKKSNTEKQNSERLEKKTLLKGKFVAFIFNQVKRSLHSRESKLNPVGNVDRDEKSNLLYSQDMKLLWLVMSETGESWSTQS